MESLVTPVFKKMLYIISPYYYWPNMTQNITQYVNLSDICKTKLNNLRKIYFACYKLCQPQINLWNVFRLISLVILNIINLKKCTCIL